MATAPRGVAGPRPELPAARLRTVACLVILLWLWSWLPQLIDLVVIGRQYAVLGTVPRRSPIAGLAYQIIILGILATCALLLLGVLASRRRVDPGRLVILVLPWAALNSSYLFHGGRNNEILLAPLVLVAVATSNCNFPDLYRLLRSLTVATAVASLALGVWRPDLFLSDATREGNNEKALIGDLLLNGLLPTSNQLGIALALGLPFVIAGGPKSKWLATPLIVFVAVWASSRTALTVIALSVCIAWALKYVGPSVARVGMTAVIVAGGVLTVVLPFIVTNPRGFSGRVAIWQVALRYLDEGPWIFGGGAMIFREVSPITLRIGVSAGTGHNVAITTLALGGVIGLLAAAALACTCVLSALARYPHDLLPLAFLAALFSMSVLEDPFRAFVVAPASFIVLPALALLLARDETGRTQ